MGEPVQATAQKMEQKAPISLPRASGATSVPPLQKINAYLGSSTGVLWQPAVLVPVFERLYQLSSGQDPGAVHILHFGDSHTVADDWTGELRKLLKARFGDGGAGFFLAGHPFAGYHRFDVNGGGTPGWHVDGLRPTIGDGFFGLGGVSISTQRPGQTVFAETECDMLEIHYLQQPGGGNVAHYDNDQRLEEFSTDGQLMPGFMNYRTSPGLHRFTLRTLDSRPVRLFGWAADRRTGVTYEALGINGAEARVMLRWDEKMFAAYLERRDPGLVVLAYGTNESIDASWSLEGYQTMFSALLQRLHQAVPNACILVIGPPDGYLKRRGKWQLFAEVENIIEAQKAACLENDCAFWDTRERMGGRGPMRDWVLAGLGQGDYIHFTYGGYQRLAAALFADIMQQYETYRRIRIEVSGPNSDEQQRKNH